jgi:hypothetical protein
MVRAACHQASIQQPIHVGNFLGVVLRDLGVVSSLLDSTQFSSGTFKPVESTWPVESSRLNQAACLKRYCD